MRPSPHISQVTTDEPLEDHLAGDVTDHATLIRDASIGVGQERPFMLDAFRACFRALGFAAEFAQGGHALVSAQEDWDWRGAASKTSMSASLKLEPILPASASLCKAPQGQLSVVVGSALTTATGCHRPVAQVAQLVSRP
jgi:hypothetical protein